DRLGLTNEPSKSKWPSFFTSWTGPTVTSVSPSQSGRQLTATQDEVDHTAPFPSISGISRVCSSRTYMSEFNTGRRTEFSTIDLILHCLIELPLPPRPKEMDIGQVCRGHSSPVQRSPYWARSGDSPRRAPLCSRAIPAPAILFRGGSSTQR